MRAHSDACTALQRTAAAAILCAEWGQSPNARLASIARSSARMAPAWFLLCEPMGDVVGCARLTLVVRGEGLMAAGLSSGACAALVESVVVARAVRGCGYGRRLMALLADEARADGLDALFLSTTDQAMFYRACGYAPSRPVQCGAAFLLSASSPACAAACDDSATSSMAAAVSETLCESLAAPPPPPPPPPPLAIVPSCVQPTWWWLDLRSSGA